MAQQAANCMRAPASAHAVYDMILRPPAPPCPHSRHASCALPRPHFGRMQPQALFSVHTSNACVGVRCRPHTLGTCDRPTLRARATDPHFGHVRPPHTLGTRDRRCCSASAARASAVKSCWIKMTRNGATAAAVAMLRKIPCGARWCRSLLGRSW
eukprot:103738-Chlamydomonas_euryale.AAC.4